MDEEFQGEVCGGNLWNSSRNNLFSSSPCLSAINNIGSFVWTNRDRPIMDMKTTKSSDDSSGSDQHEPQLYEYCNNQDLIGRSEENYSHMYIQETRGQNPSMNYRENSSINSFDQQSLNSNITSSTEFASFPSNSASYNNYTNSSLLQSLLDTNSQSQPSLLDNSAMNYPLATTYPMINSTQLLPNFTKASSIAKPLWKASGDVRASFVPSTQSQFIPSFVNNSKHHSEEARDLASVAKKVSNEPSFKRPRIETPSPLPTFKVRKEKLGDRITALQQLVSPFGKTDTASVLHEAIEYIKFLHDQVNVLSTPYMTNGSPQMQYQQCADNKINDQELLLKEQDLKSRGLCLVPISSTYPVASETTNDFWTPTFGGSFR